MFNECLKHASLKNVDDWLNRYYLVSIIPEYSLEGLMLKLKLQYFGHLMQRTDSKKTLMLGKIEGWRRRGWQRHEMVGCYHRLDGHEFEQASRVGDGQGSLACCSPWGHKELNMTERLNWLMMIKKISKIELCLLFLFSISQLFPM